MENFENEQVWGRGGGEARSTDKFGFRRAKCREGVSIYYSGDVQAGVGVVSGAEIEVLGLVT